MQQRHTYCCVYIAAQQDLYVHGIARNQCKDANSTETQKPSSINEAQVYVMLSGAVRNNFKHNYLCKGKNPCFIGLVTVTPKRKSIWKERETEYVIKTMYF